MEKLSYAEQLKHPLWQKRRLEILSRDNFTCQNCENKDEQLHVHHRYYVSGRNAWEYPDVALVTLCKSCHKLVGEKSVGVVRWWEELMAAFYSNIFVANGDAVAQLKLLENLEGAVSRGAITPDVIDLIVQNAPPLEARS